MKKLLKALLRPIYKVISLILPSLATSFKNIYKLDSLNSQIKSLEQRIDFLENEMEVLLGAQQLNLLINKYEISCNQQITENQNSYD